MSSEALRVSSCFSGADRSWRDRTDMGWCEYQSKAVGFDKPDWPAFGVKAAIVVVRPSDLDGANGAVLKAWLIALHEQDIDLDIVAIEAPVSFHTWLNHHVRAVIGSLNMDGEVRPELPSWWRRRVETHLTAPSEQDGSKADESSTGTFSLDQVRRYIDAKRQGRV